MIEQLTILVMGVMRISAHFLTSEVDKGSRSQDLDGEDFRILCTSSSDTLVFFMGLGLMTVADDDACRVSLILRILSQKNIQKVLARSVSLVPSGRITAEDLCKIFLKQFHRVLGFP